MSTRFSSPVPAAAAAAAVVTAVQLPVVVAVVDLGSLYKSSR